MAKLPTLWLQGASQRMAGAVVYQQAGRTIGRSLASSVSNPRTTSQMTQRVRLANLVQFYKVSRRWMPLAFESKPRTWSDYNAFVSANLSQARIYLTKAQAAAGAAIVDSYKVADGSLNPITQNVAGNNIITDLYTGDFETTEGKTVGEFSEAILANNNTLEAGDQISMIQYIQQTAADGTPFIVCRAYEVILNVDDTRQLSQFMPGIFIIAENSGNYCIACAANGFTGGVAFVVSRTVSTGTRVSRAYVTLTPNNTFPQQYSTTTKLSEAIASYGEGSERFLESNSASAIQSGAGSALSLLSLSTGTGVVQAGGNLELPLAPAEEIGFNFSGNLEETTEHTTLQYGLTLSNLQTVTSSASRPTGSTLNITPTNPIGESGIPTGASYYIVVTYGGVRYSIMLRNQGSGMD